jgi:thiol-disulfide isomerase/thioredoxin
VTALVVFASAIAAAGSVLDDVDACLAVVDVPCAERALARLGPAEREEPDALVARAVVDFHAGRFPAAMEGIRRAGASGAPVDAAQIALYERTTFATAGWHVVDAGSFALRYRPGPDAVLVAPGLDVLRRANAELVPLIGPPPPGTTALELYPDVRSFIAASSFMEEDVHTTGVVALSKWSRLLLTSPRAHATGYGWKDTVAHEYIHLLVSHASGDRAPVWLQEGIARALERRWIDGTDRFEIGVRAEGLLARALRDEAFISFEAMHPSLAKLPSPEAAALAYAQLGTLIHFCMERAGEGVLVDALSSVRAGADPRVALAEATGLPSFAALEDAWKAHLRGLGLRDVEAAEPPVALDGGDEVGADPVLADREDLARWLVLGDLLARSGFPEAALVEYGRAVPPELEGPSPLLAMRMAAAHRSLGREGEAMALLERSARLWPEVAPTWVALAELRAAAGDPSGALAAWEAALALDPFDVGAREAVRDAWRLRGEATHAARHAAALDVLVGHAADDIGRLLHEVGGTYELPRYRPRDGALAGAEAPSVALLAMDGTPLQPPRGAPLLLDFWATWCGSCRAAMPEIDAIATRFADRGLVVWGATDEAAATVEAFFRRSSSPRVGYTLALDPRGTTRRRFGITGLPTVVVIGRDGRIVDVVEGAGAEASRRIEAAVIEALELGE